MLNMAGGGNTRNRRFQLALGASLALHLLVLFKFGMLPSTMPTTRGDVLQVTLTAQSANTPDFVAPPPDTEPEGTPPPQTVEPAAKQVAPVKAAAITLHPAEPLATPPIQSAVAPQPAKEAAPSDQPVGSPRPGRIGAARRVEIEFEIFSGTERRAMGKARHLYASQDDHSYGVSIKQLLAPDRAGREEPWHVEISGQVNRQGLSPWLFSSRGYIPERLMSMKNVPSNPAPTANDLRNSRNPDGMLDRQSLLYQFMLVPPTDAGGKLLLTDGTTSGLYTYRVDGFESFSVGTIGNVRTMKLVLSTTASTEIIELWLIPGMNFLPAKVRHTDKLGVVTEQVVTSIDSR
jgi:hypothetical protein